MRECNVPDVHIVGATNQKIRDRDRTGTASVRKGRHTLMRLFRGAHGGGTASPPMGSAGGGTASPPGTFRGVFLSSWGPMGVEQHHHPWAFWGVFLSSRGHMGVEQHHHPCAFWGVFMSSWGPMGVEQHHHPWAFRGLHGQIIRRGHIHIGFIFVS